MQRPSQVTFWRPEMPDMSTTDSSPTVRSHGPLFETVSTERGPTLPLHWPSFVHRSTVETTESKMQSPLPLQLSRHGAVPAAQPSMHGAMNELQRHSPP